FGGLLRAAAGGPPRAGDFRLLGRGVRQDAGAGRPLPQPGRATAGRGRAEDGRCAVTVGDRQKYLRALAEAIGAAKGPAEELDAAAAALAPFAKYKMDAFAKFLA